jgi:uncharacterized protein
MRRRIPAGQGKRQGKGLALLSRRCVLRSCSGIAARANNRAAKRWENFMLGRSFQIAGPLIAALLLSMPLARAQSAAPAPSPETLTVARELVTTIHFVEQFKAVIPAIMKSLKPAVVQGRSNVEHDYDAMVPVLLDGFRARFDELSEAAAIIYASNFSTEDLRGLIAFYKTARNSSRRHPSSPSNPCWPDRNSVSPLPLTCSGG